MFSRMKILYIAHRIPYPPSKGEKIRAFHQIRCLAKQHEVHLFCLVDDCEDLPYVRTLLTYCASVEAVYHSKFMSRIRSLKALLTSSPLSVAGFTSPKLRKRLEQRLQTEHFDRIIAFSSGMAEYVRHVTGIPKIMDFVDADSDKWRLFASMHSGPRAWLYELEARRLARYEEAILASFDRSVVVSAEEAALLQRRSADRSIAVISNGVDLDYFAPQQAAMAVATPAELVFVGAMDYFPNVDAVRYFVREILPHLHEKRPDVRFVIVGRNPSRHVRALAAERHVMVTGTVPDVRPYLASASIAVAPFQVARGLQNKILEAMAMGLPVVGTTRAFEGIPATLHDGAYVADTPQDFAQILLHILDNSALRQQCALRAREYVQRHHQWQEQIAHFETLLWAIGHERLGVTEG